MCRNHVCVEGGVSRWVDEYVGGYAPKTCNTVCFQAGSVFILFLYFCIKDSVYFTSISYKTCEKMFVCFILSETEYTF